MAGLSLTARKILILLNQKQKTEGIDGLQVDGICREIDEPAAEVFRGLDELYDAGLIRREKPDTAELTPTGVEYDLLLDDSVADEYDGMTHVMQHILAYFTERGAHNITRDLVITELDVTPGDVEGALDAFDELGYPVRERVH